MAFDENVARPALRSAQEQATALKAAVERWANGPPADEPANRALAKQAFGAAFLAWQRVELLQLGPLGPATRATLGEGLRDEVYSWPTVNLCRVDAALVAQPSVDDAFFDAALVTSKGLVVLEELLAAQGLENSCPPNATINTDGSWASLGGSAVNERRRSYALGVARHIERTTSKALAKWTDPDGFGDRLRRAGEMGSVWRTPKDGLDEVFAALFVIDRLVKDLKLGGPSGITSACMATACPELAESPRLLLSSPAIVENLSAARDTFTGGPVDGAVGFDDLLVERGQEALSRQMTQALDEALAAARALNAPVQTLATTDLDRLHSLHAQVKTFTDLLKTQFVTTLSLRVPKEGAGDND
jgi:predicted lipoprotein